MSAGDEQSGRIDIAEGVACPRSISLASSTRRDNRIVKIPWEEVVSARIASSDQ